MRAFELEEAARHAAAHDKVMLCKALQNEQVADKAARLRRV